MVKLSRSTNQKKKQPQHQDMLLWALNFGNPFQIGIGRDLQWPIRTNTVSQGSTSFALYRKSNLPSKSWLKQPTVLIIWCHFSLISLKFSISLERLCPSHWAIHTRRSSKGSCITPTLYIQLPALHQPFYVSISSLRVSQTYRFPCGSYFWYYQARSQLHCMKNTVEAVFTFKIIFCSLENKSTLWF